MDSISRFVNTVLHVNLQQSTSCYTCIAAGPPRIKIIVSELLRGPLFEVSFHLNGTGFNKFRSQVHDSGPITANEFPVLLINGSCSGWASYFKQQMYYIHWMRQGGRESL